MKSLEIMNEKIEEASHPRGTNTETIWDEEVIINKNELQTIKADLEVLEILKENLYLWYTRYWIEIHTKLTTYTTPKEFKRVKQWLEENENDN